MQIVVSLTDNHALLKGIYTFKVKHFWGNHFTVTQEDNPHIPFREGWTNTYMMINKEDVIMEKV